MTQCGAIMRSVAVLDHIHVCGRPSDHQDSMDDPDHYCRVCNRFFYQNPDRRRKR